MKRLFSILFSALLVLSVLPAGFADLEGEPQQCVELMLEGNPSTGYLWQAQSSDEEIAYVQPLSSAPPEEDSQAVGVPCIDSFRVCGAAPGAAELIFTYSRPWESVQPLMRFAISVTVDEALNVITGSEIALPREEGTGWGFDMQDGTVLEITDEGGDEGDQRFTLRPMKEGFEEITFTRFSGEGQLPGIFTYRISTDGNCLSVYEIQYRSTEDAPFNPAFQFTTTDLEGNTVTEAVFAGHGLTILNFWEPWCGPCVAEMPFLEQLTQEYADERVQVIGVFASKDMDEDVQAVLDRTGVTYPILRYVKEFGPLQTGYVPTTVILDGTGAIVYGPVAGALNYAGWCALVEELL